MKNNFCLAVFKDVYYHYTSLDALYSIVKSHTFRLMSLRSSNDRTELSYKPETFISDVSRLCDAEEDQKIKEYYNLMKISCEAHKESLVLDVIQGYVLEREQKGH